MQSVCFTDLSLPVNALRYMYGLIIKHVHDKECLEQETDTPSPEEHGWMIEDSN